MPMLTDVADLLEAEGLITVGAYKLSELPDEPDGIVVLHETPGLAPQFVHGKIGAAYEYPRLQVIVRDPDYTVAYNKAHDIFRLLSNVVNAELGEGPTWYLRISPMGSPAQAPRDGNDRVIIVTNYQVSKESPGASA
jgi:hypothetical protein